MKNLNWNLKELVLLSTFLILLFTIYFTFQLSPKNYLQVSFLNVGQGDSILFQTPRSGKILVDGGKDKTILTSLGLALPVFEKQIPGSLV